MIFFSYFFGFLAIIFLIISFQTNDKNSLLKYQTVSCFSNFFQYLLMGSLMGAFMDFIAGFRNIVFSKYEKVPLYILFLFIFLITFFSMIAYKDNISLLPMLAILNYSYSLWTGNLKLIRLINVFACFLLLIYDSFIMSIPGFLIHLLEISSALVSFYRFDIKKEVV